VCLLGFAARLPLPLPRFLIPRRTYESSISTTQDILKDAARGFGSVRIRSVKKPTLADIKAAPLIPHGMLAKKDYWRHMR